MTSQFSRREFLQSSATAAGALWRAMRFFSNRSSHGIDGAGAAQRPFALCDDRRRYARVSAARYLVHLPGVECIQACDLYDGRHTLARELTGRTDLPVTRRYQDLLDNKQIDCIIAAVPDHWHKQIVVDAVSAAKDVYCEKPMSHSPPTVSTWWPRKSGPEKSCRSDRSG